MYYIYGSIDTFITLILLKYLHEFKNNIIEENNRITPTILEIRLCLNNKTSRSSLSFHI